MERFNPDGNRDADTGPMDHAKAVEVLQEGLNSVGMNLPPDFSRPVKHRTAIGAVWDGLVARAIRAFDPPSQDETSNPRHMNKANTIHELGSELAGTRVEDKARPELGLHTNKDVETVQALAGQADVDFDPKTNELSFGDDDPFNLLRVENVAQHRAAGLFERCEQITAYRMGEDSATNRSLRKDGTAELPVVSIGTVYNHRLVRGKRASGTTIYQLVPLDPETQQPADEGFAIVNNLNGTIVVENNLDKSPPNHAEYWEHLASAEKFIEHYAKGLGVPAWRPGQSTNVEKLAAERHKREKQLLALQVSPLIALVALLGHEYPFERQNNADLESEYIYDPGLQSPTDPIYRNPSTLPDDGLIHNIYSNPYLVSEVPKSIRKAAQPLTDSSGQNKPLAAGTYQLHFSIADTYADSCVYYDANVDPEDSVKVFTDDDYAAEDLVVVPLDGQSGRVDAIGLCLNGGGSGDPYADDSDVFLQLVDKSKQSKS